MGSVISAGWSWLFSTEFDDKDPVNEKINHDIDLWCSVPYRLIQPTKHNQDKNQQICLCG